MFDLISGLYATEGAFLRSLDAAAAYNPSARGMSFAPRSDFRHPKGWLRPRWSAIAGRESWTPARSYAPCCFKIKILLCHNSSYTLFAIGSSPFSCSSAGCQPSCCLRRSCRKVLQSAGGGPTRNCAALSAKLRLSCFMP